VVQKAAEAGANQAADETPDKTAHGAARSCGSQEALWRRGIVEGLNAAIAGFAGTGAAPARASTRSRTASVRGHRLFWGVFWFVSISHEHHLLRVK
jgi:hypothetical protein